MYIYSNPPPVTPTSSGAAQAKPGIAGVKRCALASGDPSGQDSGADLIGKASARFSAAKPPPMRQEASPDLPSYPSCRSG